MSNPHPVILEKSPRPFVMLVGADVHHRASICHSVDREFMHIEPISPGVLRFEDVRNVDVILVWDQGETLPDLKAQLAILDCWSPIIAISQCPTVPQVVRAVLAGALAFLEWPCCQESMREAVSNAMNLKSQLMPRRDRALKARRCLEKLTRRERQVLTEMALGMSNKAIAQHLGISPRTVEIHRANLLGKLEAKHSADAIRLELEASLLAPEPKSGLNWPAPWSLRDALN